MSKFYKTKEEEIIVVPDDVTLDVEELELLSPNSTDAAGEKHVPVAKQEGNKVIVEVGEVFHPMLDEHYIDKVYLITDKGTYEKNLEPGNEPVATFFIEEDETPEAVYEYCTLHGLWKKDLK